MSESSIEWTDAVWNPVTGCEKVSPGCANCYAEVIAKRFWPTQYRPMFADGSGRTIDCVSTSHHEDYLATGLARPRLFSDVMCHEDRLGEPLRWRKPRRVFVNSMSDLFHEAVPDSFIAKIFNVMADCPQHTFQVLTKRAKRMQQLLAGPKSHSEWTPKMWHREVLTNVWLGVSVENRRFANERIPLLLDTPAAGRFLSVEPLLEGVDLVPFMPPAWAGGGGLGWVIVGGESGPGARPFEVEWARSIVRQCAEGGVPVFVKQLGSAPIVPAGRLRHWEWGGEIGRADPRFVPTDPEHPATGPWRVVLANRKGGDMAEWPKHLRVREFPS